MSAGSIETSTDYTDLICVICGQYWLDLRDALLMIFNSVAADHRRAVARRRRRRAAGRYQRAQSQRSSNSAASVFPHQTRTSSPRISRTFALPRINSLIFALGTGHTSRLAPQSRSHIRPDWFGFVSPDSDAHRRLSIPFQLITLIGSEHSSSRRQDHASSTCSISPANHSS
jgi:hypothetical protein